MSQSPTDADDEEDRSAYNLGWQQMTRQIESGGSWSGRERNCCFLNTGGSGFADVSAVAGMDFPDDGRAVAMTDWDHDGDLDVWLTNRTAPRIRFMRNNASSAAHFLNVQLEGRRCNRDAIGARVELHLAGPSRRKLIKTLRAGDAFLSQSSKWVHFGLGDATEIEKLVVYWPGTAGRPDRTPQSFEGLPSDRWYRIVQDAELPETWSPPSRAILLKPAPLEIPEEDDSERIVLMERIPLPTMQYSSFDGQSSPLAQDASGPLLINLWATWCAPCLEELHSFTAQHEKLRAAGVQVAAFSVDGLADDNPADPAKSRQLLERLNFPFRGGFATREMLDKLDLIHDVVLSLRATQENSLSLPIPTSFLIDREHRLAVIYRGPVSVDQLLADAGRLDPGNQTLAVVPFSGKWFLRPGGYSTLLARFADRFGRRGYLEDASHFASLSADTASREGVLYEINDQLVSVFTNLGEIHQQQGRLDEAIRHYRQALRMNPNQSRIHNDLGRALVSQSQTDEAIEHFSQALQLDPKNTEARQNLNDVRAQLHR